MDHVEGLAEGGFAKVEVDHQDLGSLQGHSRCEVHDGEGLSCCRVEGGEHEHLRALLLADHQVHVGSEDSEGFVHHVTAAVLDDDPVHVRSAADLASEPLELPESFLRAFVSRELREERHREVAKVSLGLDAGVEHLHEEEIGERKAQAENQGGKDDHLPVWRDRGSGACRAHDQTGVADVDKGCEFVLLTFLEKEDIEVLDHLLLTLKREELEFPSRVG